MCAWPKCALSIVTASRCLLHLPIIVGCAGKENATAGGSAIAF